MSSSDIIVLESSEDWELWIEQVQSKADAEIWPHIDPDNAAPEQGLEKKPEKPEYKDFEPNATTYAQLTATLQKSYDNARRYYDQDIKYYYRQEDHLREIRSYILDHVSKQKKLLLGAKLTTREWLVKLKENTEPDKSFTMQKVHQQYTESLKGLKMTKVKQWIDNWEHAMALVEKYELPQMNNGIWLLDIAQAVRPFNQTLSTLYNDQANDPEKSKSSEYRKVAKKLRQEFQSSSKKATTARGSTFNADFAGEPENSNDEETKAKGRSRSRKRAGTTTIEEESSTTKKSKNKCPACDYKGHDLPDCWILFEDKRPDDYKPTKSSEARAKKVKERVAQDKELAARVEKIRREGAGDEA
jgi:hypothetical protein